MRFCTKKLRNPQQAKQQKMHRYAFSISKLANQKSKWYFTWWWLHWGGFLCVHVSESSLFLKVSGSASRFDWPDFWFLPPPLPLLLWIVWVALLQEAEGGDNTSSSHLLHRSSLSYREEKAEAWASVLGRSRCTIPCSCVMLGAPAGRALGCARVEGEDGAGVNTYQWIGLKPWLVIALSAGICKVAKCLANIFFSALSLTLLPLEKIICKRKMGPEH